MQNLIDDIVDFERTLKHTHALESKLLVHDSYYQKRLLDLIDQTHAVGKLRKENLKQLERCRSKKAEQEAFIKKAREYVHQRLCGYGALVGSEDGLPGEEAGGEIMSKGGRRLRKIRRKGSSRD
jgi:hypothetical protein